MHPRFKAPATASPEVRAGYATLQRRYQWTTLALSLNQEHHSHERLQVSLRLFKEIVLDLQCTPPLGITLDLFALWRQGPRFTPRPLTLEDKPFERFYLQLQNDVYYRLVRMPTFLRLRERWLTLPEGPAHEAEKAAAHSRGLRPALPPLSLRDQALVYLVTLLYQPIRDALVSSFRPHALAPFEEDNPPRWRSAPLDMIEQLEAQVQEPGWLSHYLRTILQEWAWLEPDQWLPPSTEHILTHFALLQTKLERVRWEQIARVDDLLTPCQNLRHFFALRDHGYRESRLPTRSTAPEGGYHGICRSGAMENMLHSELLFWDTEPQPDGFTEDLFSLRWIENELLFYEREQSRSFTWQRQLVITLDLDPGEIRYKHPDHPAPGHAMLFGFLARLCQDLRLICPEELLRFDLRLGPQQDWHDDAPLLQLYFSHLPQIGASTTLQLDKTPTQDLQRQPPGIGELRLLILSASRWHELQQLTQPLPHHLCLVWTTHPERLHTTQQAPTKESDAEEITTRTQTPAPATRTPQSMRQHIAKTPDHTFCIATQAEPLDALAQLREDVLESILKTSLVPKA